MTIRDDGSPRLKVLDFGIAKAVAGGGHSVQQTAMIGTFVVRDMLLFYVFWETMLIPMTFIIGIWGGERRVYASIKFFIYTMLPSLLMLVAILYLAIHAGNLLGAPPPSVEAIAWVGQAQWLVVLWAFWVDNHRRTVPAGR